MKKNELVKTVASEVRTLMSGESSGHDWWHVYRVWKMSQRIGKNEKADMLVVELAALLHDIADWKFNNGDESAGAREAKKILKKFSTEESVIDHVCEIINSSSYKGAGTKSIMSSIEGKIVQDADRLDGMGAIGVGRTFAFGGHMKRVMHDPDIKPTIHKTKEEYMRHVGTTINHFYEKLLLLKDRMNTVTAKKIAKDRHKYLVNFLKEFYEEWEGKK
jgi:uncharacterized protein